MPGRGNFFTCNFCNFLFSVIPHQSALRYARPRGSGRRCIPGCPGRVQASLFFHRFIRLPRIFYTSFYADIIFLSTQITLHFQYFACLFFIFLNFFKIFRFSLAQLFLCVYNCLQKAKGSSRAKRAESRMHLLDPEPDLGNANVGRYDMHIFCRYTSTYICFLISMNTSSTGSSSTTREFASAKILTQEEQKLC